MDDKVQFCSLPGTGLSDFVDRFAEESGNYPFETFFVVSTLRLKSEVARRIHEKGMPILKDRICTLGELAEFIFSECKPSIRCISDEESKLIISHIISANSQSLSLFMNNGRISIKFVQELKRFISTLIQRKIDYPACLGELQSDKSRQLAFVYSHYLKFLSNNHIVDDDILLNKAAECVSKKRTAIRRIFMYGFFEPNPLEREFIAALGSSSTKFHYGMPFADNSRIFADRGDWLPAVQRVSVESTPENARLSQLFAEAQEFDLSERIFFAKFKDRVSEIRAIAQEIRSLIASGADPARIAVALPDRDRAAGLISDIFPDFAIPYDIRKSDLLSQSTIVQAILNIIEIPAYNYKRDSVVRLLKSPYIRISSEGEGSSYLRGHEVDFESRAANIIKGRDDWKEKLQLLSKYLNDESGASDHHKKENSGIKERICRIENIKTGIEKLVSSLQKLEGKRPVREHIAALHRLLCGLNLGLPKNYPNEELRRRDARALDSFLDVLDKIDNAYLIIPDAKIDLKDFLTIVSTGLSEMRYDAADANTNLVQITGLHEISHLSYDYLFIPDMVDGEIPKTNLSQPFFTKIEMQRLNLLTKRDLLRRERYYFLAAMLAARQRLFLSCPLSEQDQPLIPTFFIRDISESYKIGSWADGKIRYSTVRQQFDDGKAISDGDYRNIGLIRVSASDARMIAEKINIENYYRKRNYKSEYDGVLNGDQSIASELSRRFNDSKIYSPTMFESYGLCPFQFYLKYILYLDAMPDVELKISSRELGGLFHRIAFKFFSDRRKNGSLRVTTEELTDAVEDIIKIAQEEFQIYSFDDDPVWYSLKQRFIGKSGGRKGILETFVRHEANCLPSCFSPANFELSIGGTTSRDLSDECSKSDPVSLDLGPGEPARVLMQGRIDRLDVTDDGQFMVIDYKTGAMNPSHRDIAAGISFQLPLYIRCIETCFPGMQGIAGTYYIIKSDGEISKKIVLGDRKYLDLFESLGRSRGIKDDYQEIISSSLNTIKKYIRDIRDGIFHPTVLMGRCPRYCDYKTVCRFDDLRLLDRIGSCGSELK